MGRNGSGRPEEKSCRYIFRRLMESGIDERAAERVLGRMGAVFQRENRVQQVVVPTVRELFDGMVSKEARLKPTNFLERLEAVFTNGACVTPFTYKGVSFNPNIAEMGERYDILDFFAWARRVQRFEPNFTFFVVDASKYAIVNAMGELSVKAYSKQAAEEALERLRKELQVNPEAERIAKSAEIRNRYLRAAAMLLNESNKPTMPWFGNCRVISADELWDPGNKDYLQSLQKAIDFVAAERVENAPLRIAKAASYKRYGQEFQKWYTVLVLAEADYLAREYNAMAKLGPTSEVAFDQLIRSMMNGSGYNVFWYSRPLEGREKDSKLVLFSDSNAAVGRKLEENPQLKEWMGEITQPFFSEPIGQREPVQGIAGAVNSLRERIGELARKLPEEESRAPPIMPPWM